MKSTILVAAVGLAGIQVPGVETAGVRELGFEERVRAQEAIERVYYAHQIGANLPFEQAVPREALERKVRDTLARSAALSKFWSTPVTGEMLRREVGRMASASRMPERLLELYDALGNRPLLVEECLARPVLVERLSRSFFAYDRGLHASERSEAAAIYEALAAGRIDPRAAHPRRRMIGLVRSNESDSTAIAGLHAGRQRSGHVGIPQTVELTSRLPIGGESVADPDRRALELSSAEFDVWRQRLPSRGGEIGPIRESREAFSIAVVLERGPDRIELASYVVPKRSWDDWWRDAESGLDLSVVSVAAGPEDPLLVPGRRPLPDPATNAEGVRSILPGGGDDRSAVPFDLGGHDVWDNASLEEVAPVGRSHHSAIWTGSVMIVWGGDALSATFDTGGRYDPATDGWTPISTLDAPSPRSNHAAVWTGTRMVVWGGNPLTNTGGRYDPQTDTWTPTSVENAPEPRTLATAVWTGTRMIVWGGVGATSRLDTGGTYDPSTDTWSPTTTAGAPTARIAHTAVWTGNRLLVWGGQGVSAVGTGGGYDPVANLWSPLATTGAPSPRTGHTAVWTGKVMVVWGGFSATGGYLGTGGRYDPATDSWTPTETSGAPPPRTGHLAVWTGDRMLVYGGVKNATLRCQECNSALTATGGRYNPENDRWADMSGPDAPSPRTAGTAVWTGAQMVVWGGTDYLVNFYTGGRYDPRADRWTPTSLGPGPSARQLHKAVWTGSLMLIWGGLSDAGFLNTGGRYDPALDAWTDTAIRNVPTGRAYHTAIWTGREMIVWGGNNEDLVVPDLRSGGRYDPVRDSWAPTNPAGAPTARERHTAVWTGSRMVLWGGLGPTSSGAAPLDTGALYDPATDAWFATAMGSSPPPRYDHTAVWTGNLMVVWGGTTGYAPLDTGGRYDPALGGWAPTSGASAPSPRANHTAVWTGREMVIWGGDFTGGTGGRYDPSIDGWTPTALADAPSDRARHSAVWTGSEMIVWGGSTDGTGALYSPTLDLWRPTTTLGAPPWRFSHTAVWTGSRMIVWGGTGFGGELESGGIYTP